MAKQSISERALAAQVTPAIGSITVGGKIYNGVKQAVVPTLRQPGETPVVFTVVDRMKVGKPMPPDPKTGQVMPRATIMRVTSLENGRLYDYIVPAILIGVFVSDYDGGSLKPDGTIATIADGELKGYNDYSLGTHQYVGKSFVVQKGKKPDGKRYREIEAIEINPAQVIEQPA